MSTTHETVILKQGEYYSLWTYDKDDFFNGRFGCTVSKDIEELKAIVGDKKVIELG